MNLKILNIEDKCTGCAACVNVCPYQCLQLKPNDEGFYYPYYDGTNCVECHLCERTCHVVTPQTHGTPDEDSFYIYHNLSDDVLERSSSGGAFSLFAEWVISQGGVVYGSAYNAEKERLEVQSTENATLDALRKSKYVESFTGASFSEIRRQLKAGRKVMYCGSPCQVRGLRQFLNSTNTPLDNIILMDFACHGVPSNDCFSQYKRMFESKRKKVVSVDFRHKDFGKRGQMWHDMTLRLGFSDGTSKVFPRYDSYYYYYEPFYNNLFLRKSCYTCDLILHSDADISIGDFWGISKYKQVNDSNKGISYICFNTDKCKSIWLEISNKGFSEKLPFDAISYQYKERKYKSQLIPERDAFARRVQSVGFVDAVCEHYGRWNILKTIYTFRIKSFIKKLIRR